MKQKQKDERKDIRTFGLGLTAVFIAIGSMQIYKGHTGMALGLYLGSGVVLLLSLLAPLVLKPVYKILTAIGHKIGWINSRILLGVLFYVFFTPVAVVFKLIGRDPLDRKIEKEKSSYWVPRKHDTDKKRYERQF